MGYIISLAHLKLTRKESSYAITVVKTPNISNGPSMYGPKMLMDNIIKGPTNCTGPSTVIIISTPQEARRLALNRLLGRPRQGLSAVSRLENQSSAGRGEEEMCGRGRCTLRPEEVARACCVGELDTGDVASVDVDKYRPSYNVSPGAYLPVVAKRREKKAGGEEGEGESSPVLLCMKWGLVPSFTKKTDKPDHYRMVRCSRHSLCFFFSLHSLLVPFLCFSFFVLSSLFSIIYLINLIPLRCSCY